MTRSVVSSVPASALISRPGPGLDRSRRMRMRGIGKREFLTAGLGLMALGSGSALATELEKPIPGRKPGTDMLGRSLAHPSPPKKIPNRMAKTTKLFMAPPGYPNCIATDPDGKGVCVAGQRHDGRR